MYGLLPPTATVVITYAHYGLKEVILSAHLRMAAAVPPPWGQAWCQAIPIGHTKR